MKKIVLFNHKGGVSKTTSTFYIGWMIAEMGHKVLLVDADPQCNLSAMFLQDKFDEYYETEDTAKLNIMNGVHNAFYGIPRPIEPFDCPKAEKNENLFLLPGHMNLSEYEAQLSFAFTSPTSMQSLQSLPGAFNDLIEKCAQRMQAEYVFIDLNPGLSTINQDLFLISDAFIIPTNPDTFSFMSIRSLSTILPKWVKWKQNNIEIFESSAYPLPPGIPKFIGEISQRFNIRNGVAVNAYKHNIEELNEVIVNEFAPKLKNVQMLFPEAAYMKAGISHGSFVLSEIKDFQGLSPISFKAGVPVFKLTEENLATRGAVLNGQKDNVNEFYEIYEKIAHAIINIFEYA